MKTDGRVFVGFKMNWFLLDLKRLNSNPGDLFKYKRVSYECKFGITARTSKNERVRATNTYKRHCPASIFASLRMIKNAENNKVLKFMVPKMDNNHNHVVSWLMFLLLFRSNGECAYR